MQLKEGRFPWDTDEIEVSNRMVLNQAERARIMILEPQFSVTASHYVKEAESSRPRVERCKALDGQACEECKKGTASRQRFGVVVVRYRALKPELQWELIPWLFGGDKYLDLKKMAKSGWSGKIRKGGELIDVSYEEPILFHRHDLILYCYNQAFQKVKFEVCEYSIWDKIQGLKKEIVTTYKQERESGRLDVLSMISGAVIESVEETTGGEESLDLEETKPNGKKAKAQPEELELGTESKPSITKSVSTKQAPSTVQQEKKAPAKQASSPDEAELEAIIDGIIG